MPGLPELDAVRVRRWCEQRVPDHVRDQVRVECDIGPRQLTIVEFRPPWREGTGPEWTRFPIARLRYTQATKSWTLYWRDRNLRFPLYDQLEPSPDIERGGCAAADPSVPRARVHDFQRRAVVLNGSPEITDVSSIRRSWNRNAVMADPGTSVGWPGCWLSHWPRWLSSAGTPPKAASSS